MKAKIISCCIVILFLVASPALAQWTYEYQKDLSLAFQDVHFPTSTTGYMVGSGGEVYKSTDAGATWAQQTTPVTATLYGVFFTSATNGWAVGASGTIITTTDGTNWAVHDSSGVMTTNTLRSVKFIGNNGWLCGGPTSATEVFYTTDGGTVWNRQRIPAPIRAMRSPLQTPALGIRRVIATASCIRPTVV